MSARTKDNGGHLIDSSRQGYSSDQGLAQVLRTCESDKSSWGGGGVPGLVPAPGSWAS